MTATEHIADEHEPHVWTDPTGHVWQLDHDFLDWHMNGWEWDGTVDPSTGPVLHSVTTATLHEALIGLAECAGLWQVPLSAPQDLAHILDPMDAVTSRRYQPRVDA